MFEKIQFKAKDIERFFLFSAPSFKWTKIRKSVLWEIRKIKSKKMAWKLWKLAPGILMFHYFLCHLVLKGVFAQKAENNGNFMEIFHVQKCSVISFKPFFFTDFSPLFIPRFFLCFFSNNLKLFYCWWKNKAKLPLWRF